MKTEQQKALDKIKKCLKLAGSSNANEAAIALGQAQALMKKHNLTLTDIQAADVTRVGQKASVKSSPAQWETMLANSVARAFGCKLIFREGFYAGHRGEWGFIGVDISPELAAYAFAVLLRQLKRDRADYVKNQLKRCKLATKRSRAFRYCENWVYAVWEKVQDIAPSQEASTAIAAYMEKRHGKTQELKSRGNTKTSKRGIENDAKAGFAAGSQAQLNRPVTGRAKQDCLEPPL